ncbi:MAG: glycosyltransferase family 1 protein [Kiritimatiellia bacterium]|jgi:glycosyltransferase involved in cell wall biosynthesis|nr:glycosyltransferase family 1 protein [Kiritimatiellia bacterium]MDP6811444.1 glycosyltransferase family 1 protein [Kiritimatiellia bacterium]MDP7024496.1 glycosyltransferase family 1 protein [Kiritimatiellia bacterium]
MHIAINGRGLRSSVGGTKTYMERIIPALATTAPQNRYTLCHGSSDHRGIYPGVEDVFLSAPHRLLWENAVLPKAIRALGPNLLFCPKLFVPWFTPRHIKTVVVVHDLLYFKVAKTHIREYLPADVLYVRLFLQGSLKRADAVICVSEHTRNDVIALFDVDPGRVHSVHHGVLLPSEGEVSAAARDSARRRYGLTQPFIFYCGSLSPRKNMVRALEAFATISDTVPHAFVVTGGKSWKDQPVFDAVKRLGLEDRFVCLGHVADEDMPAMFSAADLFVYPSLYEGFGMPVLEAMACGCPVLASNTSSIPEVAGDAAHLTDPVDTDAMSQGMLRILTDPSCADNLRRLGRERAAAFTWEESASRLLAIFGNL